jgi:phosphoribosyl-ATP pyrophosphohydrolase
MLLPTIEISCGRAMILGPDGCRHPVEEDVLALVRRFGRSGEVLLTDVDAAAGTGDNEALVRQAVRHASCLVSGGIRDEEKARRLLRAGALRVVLSSEASTDLLSRLPRYRTLVALDLAEAVNGDACGRIDRGPVETMQILSPYCSGFLCSGVGHDDSLVSIADRIAHLAQSTGMYLALAIPGVGPGEVRTLDRLGVDVRVGLDACGAALSPEEAFAACMDFTHEPLPTVVSDTQGQVLRMGWSSRESLLASLMSGRLHSVPGPGGAAPGSTADSAEDSYELLRASVDRGRSSLWFQVRPVGAVRDRAGYSSFGNGARDFGLHALFDVIMARRKDPRPGSYTSFLFEKDDRIPRKLTEEIYELLTARGREDIIWEAADVMFFLLAYLARTGVSLDEVIAELAGRER